MASSSKYDDLLQNSLQTFRQHFHAEVPLELKHFSGFCEEEQINRVAKKVKVSVLRDFLTDLSNQEDIQEEKVSSSCLKFGEEIREITTNCIARHKEYKAEAEALVEKKIHALFTDLKTALETNLSLNLMQDVKSIDSFFENGKSIVLDSFELHWHHGNADFFENQKKKLTKKLEELESEILERQRKVERSEVQIRENETNGSGEVVTVLEELGENGRMNLEETTNLSTLAPEIMQSNMRPENQTFDMNEGAQRNQDETEMLRIRTDIFEEDDDVVEIEPNSLELLARTYEIQSDNSEKSEKRKQLAIPDAPVNAATSIKRPRLDEPPISTSEEIYHPLIFRLSASSITMGTRVGNSFTRLKQEHPILGITNYGNLVCGAQAVGLRKEKRWSFMDFLRGTPPKEKVSFVLGKEIISQELNLEFFLSSILRIMKDDAERQLSRNFDHVIITVPCWLCCPLRVQIKDAATIAGFTEMKLVNQETIGAFAYVNRCIPEKRNCDVLVLTENFGVISAILYEWKGKILTMIYDDYKVYFGNLWEKGSNSNSRWPVVSNIFWSLWKSLPIRNQAKPNLNKAVLITESPDWLKVLTSVAKKMLYSWDGDSDEVVSTSKLFGASVLSDKKTEDFCKIVKEYLPTCLLSSRYDELSTPFHYVSKIVPSKTSIPTEIMCQVPLHSKKRENGKLTIFQENLLCQKMIPLGHLEFYGDWVGLSHSFNDVVLTFQITDEAIFLLERVQVKMKESGETETLKQEEFTWVVPALRDTEK